MEPTRAETARPLPDLLAALPDELDAPVCSPSRQTELTAADVIDVAELIGIDFAMVPFSIDELQLGIEMELEHRRFFSQPAATGADLVALGQAALAHLCQRPDFYTRLSTAHSPGDPLPPEYRIDEVGAD